MDRFVLHLKKKKIHAQSYGRGVYTKIYFNLNFSDFNFKNQRSHHFYQCAYAP